MARPEGYMNRTAQTPTVKETCVSLKGEKTMLKCSDDPVYENKDYDNMSDEDWEQEMNVEDDYDGEPYEDVVDDYDGWDLDEEEEYE